ncbi:hypothetical protein A2U01_0091538, partial [Trifolium medium]|nr:hypothetical protein [Trifolium medium]
LTDLSVGAPAGTQSPSTSSGSEQSNVGHSHSSDQVRSGRFLDEFSVDKDPIFVTSLLKHSAFNG